MVFAPTLVKQVDNQASYVHRLSFEQPGEIGIRMPSEGTGSLRKILGFFWFFGPAAVEGRHRTRYSQRTEAAPGPPDSGRSSGTSLSRVT